MVFGLAIGCTVALAQLLVRQYWIEYQANLCLIAVDFGNKIARRVVYGLPAASLPQRISHWLIVPGHFQGKVYSLSFAGVNQVAGAANRTVNLIASFGNAVVPISAQVNCG